MKQFFLIFFALCNINGYSQTTEQNYYNLIQSRDSFYNANSSSISTDEDGDFAQYSKFKNFFSTRVDENGSLFRGSQELMNYINSTSSRLGGCTDVSSDWNSIGPTKIGAGSQNNGRIEAIAIDPTNSNIIYAGSNSGGLWKTTNANSTTPVWNNKTDEFGKLSVGVASILLLPTNPNVIYIATGTSFTYGVGVICSYNGGDTWHKTGLSFVINEWEQVVVKKLIYIPSSNSNDTTIIAITRTKIWKTHNGKPSLPWDEVYSNATTYPLWEWNLNMTTVNFTDLEVNSMHLVFHQLQFLNCINSI